MAWVGGCIWLCLLLDHSAGHHRTIENDLEHPLSVGRGGQIFTNLVHHAAQTVLFECRIDPNQSDLLSYVK